MEKSLLSDGGVDVYVFGGESSFIDFSGVVVYDALLQFFAPFLE